MTYPGRPSNPVTIVGGGPVGLSLAIALARHGVGSTLLERKPTISEHSKAPAIHIRTREAFRQWGVDERFLDAGTLRPELVLHSPADDRALLAVDFSELDDEADRPGVLVLEQGETERLLLEAVQESGWCDVRFSTTAIGLHTDDGGVTVTARDDDGEYSLTSRYVVGCDGAGSFVRTAIGQPFAGITYRVRPMLADVILNDERDGLLWPRTYNGPAGITTTLRIRPNLWRVIWLHGSDGDAPDEVTDAEVEDRVAEVLGPGPVDVVWASRFRIHRRSSPRFRVGRVLLAGDAAHVHSPVGGLGMNAGIQDAHNLAWKLAYALRGGDVDRLLDSYDAERRAVVVESVSQYTDVLTRLFLQTPAAARSGLFAAGRLAMAVPMMRRQAPRRASMLDLGYPDSPLLRKSVRAAGTRLPNVAVQAPDGSHVRLHDLLGYEPALLDSSEEPDVAAKAPVGRVIRLGDDAYRDPSGRLDRLTGGRPGWTLVRPDGHVAWVLDRPDRLSDAIAHALGGPT